MTGGRSGSPEWLRSTYCNGGACVEVARSGERIAVRNSGNPGNRLTFPVSNWRDFVADIKNGEFSVDRLTAP